MLQHVRAHEREGRPVRAYVRRGNPVKNRPNLLPRHKSSSAIGTLTDEEIIERYLAGESQYSIAQSDGRTIGAVHYILEKHGIAFRDPLEEQRRGGRIQGARNIESGHLAGVRARGLETLAANPQIRHETGQRVGRARMVLTTSEQRLEWARKGGLIGGRKNVESGWIQSLTLGKPASKGAGTGKGSYSKKGDWVRSTWERALADWYLDSGVQYQYEPRTFDLGDGVTYRPDFYLPETDTWVEVKGYMRPEDQIKLQKFRNAGYMLVLIDESLLKELRKEQRF